MLCFMGPQRSECMSSKGVVERDDFVGITCCCCFVSTQVSHSSGVSQGVRILVFLSNESKMSLRSAQLRCASLRCHTSIESDLQVFVDEEA